MRATNVLLAGKTIVVAGFGWCGRGIARVRAAWARKSSSPRSIPRKALEAAMEGYAVMPMNEAASRGDIFITVTGNTHVLA